MAPETVIGSAVGAADILLATYIVQKMTQEVSIKQDDAVALEAAVEAATSQVQNLATSIVPNVANEPSRRRPRSS